MNDIKAILFDLDGTLLDIEVSFFLDTMVTGMAGPFASRLPFDGFRDALFFAIEQIMASPRAEGESNADGFMAAFSRRSGMDLSEAASSFEAFYSRTFPGLAHDARPVEGAADLVREAGRRGYRLALATNPIFPLSAVLERLKWGGIDPGLFDFIPALETTRSCKPQPEYFLETSAILGVAPEHCLMVGNDVEQDLVAARVGMRIFLADRKLVQRGPMTVEPDGRGSLEDLGRMLGLGKTGSER